MDIRLKTAPFEFNGKKFELCCNMNVLADIQEEFDGRITDAFNSVGTTRTALKFLAAMCNDYADSQGWPERYTDRQIGREMAPTGANIREIAGLVSELVYSSIKADVSEQDADTEENEKN